MAFQKSTKAMADITYILDISGKSLEALSLWLT